MTLISARAFKENHREFDGFSLDRRDPDYIRDCLPSLEWLYRHYFRVTAEGFSNIPPAGPMLLVGNHNGGVTTPDSAMFIHAWFRSQGVERPAHALSHPSVFSVPYLNVHLMKIGSLAATAKMAMKVMERGFPLLIYPGSGGDVYKTWSERHTIKFCGNDAFVRLALRYHAPIVPVVALGGHDTLIVLDDGEALARSLGLTAVGIERIPLTFSIPNGLQLGMPMNIPFPAKIDIEIGRPIRLINAAKNAEHDPTFVRAAYDHVVGVMQDILCRMVAKRSARAQTEASPSRPAVTGSVGG